MNRKQFLQTGTAFAAIATTGLLRAEDVKAPATTGPQRPTTPEPDRGPPLGPALVKAFVGAGHADLAKVKELLAEHPTLLNAAWDWGSGDYETALGGAAHMGAREIAEFLIASGARMDVFAAAMLGRLEVVKAVCNAFPNTPKVLGPHGIPLMVHAKKGGSQAGPVVGYLNSLTV